MANNIPPAPPPLQPMSGQSNPYDFITNSANKPKKSLLSGGGSKTRRIIIVGVGAVVLLMVGLIVASLLRSGGASQKIDYLSLVQQQAELIRISEIGVSKSRQSTAKNLAITTSLSLASQQTETLELAKKAGASTDPKTLALSKNAKTDELLTSADQSNQFDQTFIETLKAALEKYRTLLRKIYQNTAGASAKQTLSEHYKSISDLLGTEATDKSV